MKTISINRGAEVAMKIELHDPLLQVVVHDEVKVQPQPKPHQFEAGIHTAVECTPAQRAEIIRVAKECDRKIYHENGMYPCLYWSLNNELHGYWGNSLLWQSAKWISFDEFVSRLKGEWFEPKPEPDYSHLIGKWVKYTHQEYKHDNWFGRWAQIKSCRYLEFDAYEGCNLKNAGWQFKLQPNKFFDDFEEYHERCFDLSNPLDYNPDEPKEVRIPFSADRMHEAIRFETRHGSEVKCVVVNDVDMMFYVTGFPDGFSNALTWDKNGRHDQHEESILDLFMWVKEGGVR
jgi:hypothetical protein